MLTPSRAKASATLVCSGFDPRQEVARLRRGHEGALMFAVAAAALTVSSVLLPSFSWASGTTSGTTGAPAALSVPAEKGGGTAVTLACSGQVWGNENASCLAAIAVASGRQQARQPRHIEPTAAL